MAGPPENMDVGDFINTRLGDADEDPDIGPTDGVLNYNYEGNCNGQNCNTIFT